MTNVNTAIEVRNVTRKFGDVKALDDVSLSIEQHTISALLGANGAGKTTLMSLLAGHDRPTSGALRVGEAVPFKSSVLAAHTSFIRGKQCYPDYYFILHFVRSGSLFHANWEYEFAA